MNAPTQEYGYILIDTPEKKAQFAPKRKGDQHFASCGSWEDCCCATDRLHRGAIYRRRISPGEGWELVPENELHLRPADFEFQFYSSNGNAWAKLANASGRSLREWLNQNNYMLAFRRPKSQQTGWVRCSERLPRKEEYPVWVCGADNQTAYSIYGRSEAMLGMPAGWPFSIGKSTGWDIGIWCWMRAVMPTPPPEPTPAEKAWDALTDKPADAKAAFIAGFEKGGAK